MAETKKKPTHAVIVHPSNGIHLRGIGHHKHGRHELALTTEQLEELAEAQGITLISLAEEAKAAAEAEAKAAGDKEPKKD